MSTIRRQNRGISVKLPPRPRPTLAVRDSSILSRDKTFIVIH
jgi:hypothetical protein